MMLKKTIAFICSVLVCTACVTTAKPITVSAASQFTFNKTMSKEVLRSYASRAVTLAGFLMEGMEEDPIFEEDLRMLRRIGAKYIGRAAYYSWSGNLSLKQINEHYNTVKKKAALVHKADSEMILQAGVFEIMYRGTVEATPVPSYVFEAFGLPVVTRNFKFDDMLFPKGNQHYIGYWGNDASAVPYMVRQESQMYFYYQITRYIDCGIEAFHIGQAEKMIDYNAENTPYWEKVLTLARNYAKTNARRGIALFDCHTAITSGGMKVGNRLLCDIQGAGIVPNETQYKDEAYMCEISDYKKCWLQWIGRSEGGQHPLGFSIENNFTILEFDNYGGNGKPGIATKNAFYNWGYDDITWFATQPEWYRNQFLIESNNFVKNNVLDSAKKQVYFIQPSCRRVMTPEGNYPEIIYKPTANANADFIFDYLDNEKTTPQYTTATNTYVLTVKKDYRANRNGDGCPNGFGQEDTIREIFLGKNAQEDSELLKVVLPAGYTYGGNTTSSSSTGKTSSTPGKTSSASGTSTGTSSALTSRSTESSKTISGDTSEASDISEDTSEMMDSLDEISEQAEGSETSSVAVSGKEQDKKSILPIVLGIIGGVIVLGGAGAGVWLFRKKKSAQ